MIGNFTANPPTISAGGTAMLSGTDGGAEYTIVTLQVAPVRGRVAMVTPAETTTYTLNATNQFGRTTATVKVTVQ